MLFLLCRGMSCCVYVIVEAIILHFVHGADKELKKAEREALKLKTSDFDMPTIVCEQKRIHDHYRKKEEKIGVYLC